MAKLVDRPPEDWLARGSYGAVPLPYAMPVAPPQSQPDPLPGAALLGLPLGYRLGTAVINGQPLLSGSLPTIGGSLIGGGLGNAIGGFGRDPTSQLVGSLGSGVGAAIGQVAIPIPGVGAAIGSAFGNVVGRGLSSVFCFAPGTRVRMADGTTRPIETLQVGEQTAGGVVLATQRHPGVGQPVFRYGHVLVTGGHAVLEMDGWVRVRESKRALAMPDVCLATVHNLVTSRHRILVDEHCFADAAETDADLADLGDSLAALRAA